MGLSVLEGAEALERLAPEWDALAARSARTPFQTPRWHREWWRHVGAHRPGVSPYLVALREGGRLAAVAPLMRDGDRLRFHSDPYADYHDLLADGGAAGRARAAIAVADHVAAGTGDRWRTAELREMPRRSALAVALAARGGADAGGSVCPRLTLRDAASLRRATERREHAVKERRLARLGELRCRHFTRPDDVAARMEGFMALHLRQWLPRADRGITFDDADLTRFYAGASPALAAAGVLMVTELTLDDHALAYYYGFVFAGRYWGYRTTFDPDFRRYSPGHLMHRAMFRHLAAAGFGIFDFMRGDEAYKREYADHTAYTRGIRLGASSVAERGEHRNRSSGPDEPWTTPRV
jgi:CelD/BcsL family acetyltransferase involved in cellulose biosynthesis